MANEPPSVNAAGQPVPDPTKNVLDLVEAKGIATQAQFELNNRWQEKYIDLHMQRQDDLRRLEADHLIKLLDIQAAHEEQLRVKEAARLDAIRAVDNAAVTRASEVAAVQASALAATVQATAEVQRNASSEGAVLQAAALEAAIKPLRDAVDDLRNKQFTQQGEKQAQGDNVSDRRSERGLSQQAIAILISAVLLAIALYTALHT